MFNFKDRVMKKSFPVSEIAQSIGTVISAGPNLIVQWDVTNQAEVVEEDSIMPIPFTE